MALAIDKPAGWMLVPFNWQRTRWNLQAAIESSLAGGAFWARSRNLRFLRYVHRLDAETTGVMLFAKSRGALDTLADLFEARRVEKSYLAVATGTPREKTWTCRDSLGPDPACIGRVRVDGREGKPAETEFQVLAQRVDPQLGPLALIQARPFTGRTHQIRVHLATAGQPVLGDEMYGNGDTASRGMALRSIRLTYLDPFTRRPVDIRAETGHFLRRFGFASTDLPALSSPLPPSRPRVTRRRR